MLLLTAASAAGAPSTAVGAAMLPAAPARTLSFLHVGPISGPSGLHQIVDAHNREVLLKGVNVDGITGAAGYYYGPGNPVTP